MNTKTLSAYIFFGACFSLFVSCTRQHAPQKVKKDVVIYPSPPDTTRIQFLTSFISSENTINKQSAFSKFLFGAADVKPIKKPYGIAVYNGLLFICDTGLGALEIIDLQKNTFEYFSPKGKGQLQMPINCYVDNDGNLYVADSERKQVVVFDRQLNYVGAFGEPDNFKPTDVFVRGDKIWVTNIKNSRINVYSKETYQMLYYFPENDTTKESSLFSPTNLFVTNDRVYVSDMGDFRVKIYTPEGKFLASIGGSGNNIGQFVRPKGIAVDRDAHLYVVDAGFENTQIFNEKGKVLMFFGGPYKGPGDMWLPAKVTIDYDNLSFFQKYVDPAYDLNYLVFVTNQYGPEKINVYGAVTMK